MPITIDYTIPPDGQMVEDWLRGMGVWPSDSAQSTLAQTTAQINVGAAIRELERRTGWKPFVNTSGASVTRYFDAVDHTGEISLRGGLLYLSSFTVNGVARTVDVNAFPTIEYNPDGSAYITALKVWPLSLVQPPRYVRPNQIAVTGVWGRFAEWPEDAWMAVMVRATRNTLASINQENDLGSIGEGPNSMGFDLVGVVSFKDVWGDWRTYWEEIVAGYRRLVA